MNYLRRLIALAVTVCLAFSCCVSFAAEMTQNEWNESCKYKLSQAASVYESPDKNPGTKLSAGTYIMVQGSVAGWKYIKYYKNGETYLGWVKEDAVVTSSGEAVATAKPTTTPDAGAGGANQSAEKQDTQSSVLPTVGIANATANTDTNVYKAASATGEQVTSLTAGEAVTVTGMGLCWCSVQTVSGGGYVPTQSLDFAGAEGEYTFAVAASASAGHLTLREKADGNAKAICSVPDGTIALVLDETNSFTHVLVDGKEGYMNTHYLLLFNACAPSETMAQVINPNSTNKSTKVNMRSKGDTGATVVEQVKTGSTVLVINESDGWTEIEYNGLHGYMQSKYLEAE